MSKISLVPFKEEHLKTLRVRETLVKEDDALECFLNYIPQDPDCQYLTFMVAGHPVACGGIARKREGVGEIHMVTSDDLLEVSKEFNTLCNKALFEMVRHFKLHRVEGYVRFDFRLGRWWARQMGFTAEGIMRQFGSDKADYYLFARTF